MVLPNFPLSISTPFIRCCVRRSLRKPSEAQTIALSLLVWRFLVSHYLTFIPLILQDLPLSDQVFPY
jgi:hypothetical protein